MTLGNAPFDNTKDRCSLAAALARLYDQSFLRCLSENTTPAQYQAVFLSLEACYHELSAQAQADWLHYTSAYQPDHCCVREIYTQATYHLLHRSILTPAPPPAPPLPPAETLSEVLEDLQEMYQPDPDATRFGEQPEDA
jgi:hypothetical protein